MAKVDYSQMSSAELQREQERLSASIDRDMRRLKIALYVFVGAITVAALSALISALLTLHVIP